MHWNVSDRGLNLSGLKELGEAVGSINVIGN